MGSEFPLAPNLATAARVILTLVLHAIYDGNRVVLLAVLAIAASTDILDGWLARRLRAETAWGRGFDSLADFFLFSSGAWWLWRLQPEMYSAHVTQWSVVLVAFAVPQAAAWYRLRRNAAFHLYTARFTGAWALFCFFWALLVGYQPLFHGIFTAAMVVRNLEALAMLLLLKDPYSDLRPSIFLYRRDELSVPPRGRLRSAAAGIAS
jgi:phosphatidylglycerophosphate synthase